MKYVTVEHNQGFHHISQDIRNEINTALDKCTTTIKKGSSPKFRDELHNQLMINGWPPEVQIDPSSRISITSVKNMIGLCLQTGNMGRMYADLLKLQTVYQKKIVTAGVLVVPTKDTAKSLGDNITNYDRLCNELVIFEKAITIPLVLYGFYE